MASLPPSSPPSREDPHWPSIARQIWESKYRLKAADGRALDATLEETWRRVAVAAASAERKAERAAWAETFFAAMADFTFIPAGRILAGAGAGREVTLFNCFVLGRIEDDLGAIFDSVKQAALTMQAGGGIGHDFSTLRPKGALVRSIGADASGPVSFMDVWDAMCQTIMSAGQRRGAMMATLRCDHPDIELFVEAKRDAKRLRNFNLSVLVTDAFVAAVDSDAAWPLVFDGKVMRTVAARGLWDRIARATYDVAEPGVIFIDQINARNNLAYCETIAATNPCGEQPLPPYGACLLGSINLARLVVEPFMPGAHLDEARLADVAKTAVRFLDNCIDVSRYPLPEQKREATAKRRLGLGVTGLADALILLGVRYGSAEARRLTGQWMARIQAAAYSASAALAAEKGAFPLYDAGRFLAAPGVLALPENVRAEIRDNGMRNGLLTSVAPTGTISLLAGNVSSGIEPVFDLAYDRRILEGDGSARHERVEDYAYALYRRRFCPDAPLTDAFVTSADLTPADHLAMQAAAQAHVDSAISKTINCPADITFDAFKDVYRHAFSLGLKGCTTYRPNATTGSVLTHSRESSTVPTAIETQKAAAMTDQAPAIALRHRTSESSGGVVYMSEPLQRDPVLAGYTYKLRWPASDHALYITINDIEVAGRRRPFEIFINSKNLEHYAWTLALTRMISAVFRRGGDVSFVVEELKAVFDPQGGRWMDGAWVPSLLAAIGGVIETHLRRIGCLDDGDGTGTTDRERRAMRAVGVDATAFDRDARSGGLAEPWSAAAQSLAPGATVDTCPRCSAPTLVREAGCMVCRSCGYSKCG